jgi:osmotically-inducible protein OsmY
LKTIALTKGHVAVVDDEDFSIVSQWKWYAQINLGGVYAARREGSGGRLVYMHRLINATPSGMVTDHIDGNGLNNTRANLRTATHRQNAQNQRPQRKKDAATKGAWYDASGKQDKRWRSAIRVNGKLKYLGRYHTQQEAASAYAVAASQLFGQFANFQQGITP